MMRYRILAIAAIAMTLPSLQAGACNPPSVGKSILKPTQNDLLSTVSDDDLARREDYLKLQRSSEKRKWKEEHDDAISCGHGCLGLTPIVTGMCFDGLATTMEPCLDRLPVGAAVGLLTSVTLMTAFSYWYQPPETETSAKLALVLQESKRRKEKVD